MTYSSEGLSIFGDGYSRNILTGVWTPGSVFYVDTAANGGSDSNSGSSAAKPMLTINAAIDKCTANKGDVIQVLGNSPSSPNDGTATITMDVAGVTLRGLYGRGMLSDSGFAAGATNTATITIAAHYCTVENLYLGCHSAGTTGGIIEFTGSMFGVTFRNILFDTQYVAAYGILSTNDQPYMLVEDCVFGRNSLAGYTTAGIHLGNGTDVMIRRNVFKGVGGIGINMTLNCGNVTVLDNKFFLQSDTVGEAITCADGSSDNYFDGNSAGFGNTQPANNPYRDLNNDTSNTWARNFSGGVAVMPIGA